MHRNDDAAKISSSLKFEKNCIHVAQLFARTQLLKHAIQPTPSLFKHPLCARYFPLSHKHRIGCLGLLRVTKEVLAQKVGYLFSRYCRFIYLHSYLFIDSPFFSSTCLCNRCSQGPLKTTTDPHSQGLTMQGSESIYPHIPISTHPWFCFVLQ